MDFSDVEDFKRRARSTDFETHLIQDGLLAPPLVCGSIARWTAEGAVGQITDAKFTRTLLKSHLRGNEILVGVNFPFDLGVALQDDPSLAAAIFAKYDRGEVFDVPVAYALLAIGRGHLFADPRTGGKMFATKPDGKRVEAFRYSLELLTEYLLGRTDAKAHDRWRMRYAMLEGVPIADWPPDAQLYPVEDAVNALECAVKVVEEGVNLQCVADECRAAFALHLSAAWGVRTDAAQIEKVDREALARRKKNARALADAGLTSADGDVDEREVKRRLARAHGAHDACTWCEGTGKVRAGKNGNEVVCTTKNLLAARDAKAGIFKDGDAGLHELEGCDGTGLHLADAEMLARTPTGGMQASRDLLPDAGDEDLLMLAEHLEDEKWFTTYKPYVIRGVDRALNLRPNVLVKTGRASYGDVIQQIPREGGIRACFVPRPGFTYASTDYEAGELCALAQVCLKLVGYSVMADVINASGKPGDLHADFAAQLLGTTAAEVDRRRKAGDEQAKMYRQFAKIFNFGLGGGMGAAKTVLSARKKSAGTTTAPDGHVYWGIRFCVALGGARRCGDQKVREWKGRECAPVCRQCVEIVEQIRRAWFDRYHCVKKYHEIVGRQAETTGDVVALGNGMLKGACGFTDGANYGFQNLIAQAAKRGLWRVTRAMYAEPESPLYGSRVAAFMHDELLTELREDRASEAAVLQAKMMVDAAREVIPDVTVVCEPALMRRWHKGAEAVWENGRLVPWEPKEKTP